MSAPVYAEVALPHSFLPRFLTSFSSPRFSGSIPCRRRPGPLDSHAHGPYCTLQGFSLLFLIVSLALVTLPLLALWPWSLTSR
ncbi:hypothetical protein OH76DRAFT_1397109 [Lentinus brumalis]|uniref:Uncharacterized protein n=1 Tax=Lentinus brumalis TaxID=2498619 RepID=A0A371DT70_9APHY|nr:hypothetical protein OH76DRAFT_1397109 [Polyporus brumalis]